MSYTVSMKVRGVFKGVNEEATIHEIEGPGIALEAILETAEYVIIGLPGGSTVQYSKIKNV